MNAIRGCRERQLGVTPGLGSGLRIVLLVLVTGCAPTAEPESRPPNRPIAISASRMGAIRTEVERFCGECHGVPSPATFPRESWPREVKRGFAFYYESFRSDLSVPEEQDVIAFYQALAPDELTVPVPRRAELPPPIRFVSTVSRAPEIEPPAVAAIHWLQLPGDNQRSLSFCDMRTGDVARVFPRDPQLAINPFANLKNPARIAVADIDQDGGTAAIVAELGSFFSEDHQRGAVFLLSHQTTGFQTTGSPSRQRLLMGGLGRVADVQPGDLDQDGDVDLVVAEFGHLWTGRVLIQENLGVDQGASRFRQQVLDDRHGCIQVPLVDLNGDGRLDILALVSQEHEAVVAFINEGEFRFQRQLIYSAGDPSYGSSGIQSIDLDRDGDVDVLYSNGDTFGSEFLKPYHGITWLENRGTFPFVVHRVADMVGVQRALAADLDQDGDLDIAAVGFLPGNLVDAKSAREHDSIMWLEQTAPDRFIRHSLETGRFLHAALETGDFDEDGDIDLAVGNFQNTPGPRQPSVSVWWNQRVPQTSVTPASAEAGDHP